MAPATRVPLRPVVVRPLVGLDRGPPRGPLRRTVSLVVGRGRWWRGSCWSSRRPWSSAWSSTSFAIRCRVPTTTARCPRPSWRIGEASPRLGGRRRRVRGRGGVEAATGPATASSCGPSSTGGRSPTSPVAPPASCALTSTAPHRGPRWCSTAPRCASSWPGTRTRRSGTRRCRTAPRRGRRGARRPQRARVRSDGAEAEGRAAGRARRSGRCVVSAARPAGPGVWVALGVLVVAVVVGVLLAGRARSAGAFEFESTERHGTRSG